MKQRPPRLVDYKYVGIFCTVEKRHTRKQVGQSEVYRSDTLQLLVVEDRLAHGDDDTCQSTDM